MTSPQPLAPSPQLLILASGSPRRRELLREAGYNFTVMPPAEDAECGVCRESGPAGLVAELAYRKAAAVVRQLSNAGEQDKERGRQGDKENALEARSPCLPVSLSPCLSAIVLAADTVAECDGFILGKPCDEAAARAMLNQLSGREHRVLTGVCLWPVFIPLPPEEGRSYLPLPLGEGRGEGAPLIRIAVTKLRMDCLTDQQLNEYIASGQWEGKAGAFGYQDRLGWVHIVAGSESNVVGLPMELLAEMLADIAGASAGQGAGNTSP